jgi:hypothetical protein
VRRNLQHEFAGEGVRSHSGRGKCIADHGRFAESCPNFLW